MATMIEVENLGKKYRLGGQDKYYKTLRDSIVRGIKRPFKKLAGTAPKEGEFWALRNASFKVDEGEVVGIIGRNGAGKSTLLKLLSRITRPTEGRAKLYGRVGSLLEVGTGFHPELTGRENIYLSGNLLGMTRAEVRKNFDAIVDFSEVERFLETPVKHYSSGMYVRLGFAIAAHLDPEILLVDEVLAVGDAQFQKKCLGKMDEVAKAGRTVLFVSHNMAAIEKSCGTCILLDQGKISKSGNTETLINAYMQFAKADKSVNIADRSDREGNHYLKITDIEFIDSTEGILRTGQNVRIRFHIANLQKTEYRNVGLNIGIDSLAYGRVCLLGTRYTGETFTAPAVAAFSLDLSIPRFPLMPGVYDLNAELTISEIRSDYIQQIATMQVEDGDYYGTGLLPYGHGVIAMPHSFSL